MEVEAAPVEGAGAGAAAGDDEEVLVAVNDDVGDVGADQGVDERAEVVRAGGVADHERDPAGVGGLEGGGDYALVELAGQLECELPFISTCDCPAAEGFRCLDGICAWNYL